MAVAPPTIAKRLLAAVRTARSAIRKLTASPNARPLLLALGAVLFLGTGIFAYSNLPDAPSQPAWHLLALVALGFAPLTAVLSGVEYRLTARMVGADTSWRKALEISVASSAANLLPLPGSYLLRTAALRTAGADRRSSLSAPLSVGLAWVGIGGILGGSWLVVTEPTLFAALMLLLGIGLLWLSAATAPHEDTRSVVALRLIWLVEVTMTTVAGLRFFFVLVAFGFDVSIGQALALATSGILATAVGIVPGGLGLRELLAGAFAPLVALSASVGVLAAIVNRIAGMVGLMAVSAVLTVVSRAERSSS